MCVHQVECERHVTKAQVGGGATEKHMCLR